MRIYLDHCTIGIYSNITTKRSRKKNMIKWWQIKLLNFKTGFVGYKSNLFTLVIMADNKTVIFYIYIHIQTEIWNIGSILEQSFDIS